MSQIVYHGEHLLEDILNVRTCTVKKNIKTTYQLISRVK
jgi:hypothetical protein